MRREALKRNWRDATILCGVTIATLVATLALNGVLQVVAAFVLGVCSMLVGLLWIIGGEVWSLPPVWGAVGEEQTGQVLDQLDSTWWVEHDIPHGFGNYDHVLIGPPGVFLLDTKRLSRPAAVRNDELKAGGMRYSGLGFRRAAVTLAEALRASVGTRPWVQSVVVIWGTLTHETREEGHVLYVQGENLVGWLQAQPTRLSRDRCEALVSAVSHLRDDSLTPR